VNRVGHQAAAHATWLMVCTLERFDGSLVGWQYVLAGAVVASSAAADDWSPDADQGGWAAKVIPGGHRGITHTPEAVAAALWLAWTYVDPGLAWAVVAVACAWGSHLVVDSACGRLPFAVLLGRRCGFGWGNDSRRARALAWGLAVASIPLAWAAVGGPLPG